MITGSWKGVSEDSHHTVTKEKVNELLKTMRQRLIIVSNRNLEEYTLRNIFRSFDMDTNGSLSV